MDEETVGQGGAVTTARCALCAAEMTCTPEGQCWCMALPPVMALPAGENAGCFCPECLRNIMTAGLSREPAVAEPGSLANIESPSGQPDNFETLPEGS